MDKNNLNSSEITPIPSYKILLLGNSAVGKTCIIIRYSENKFIENYDTTIGLNYKLKQLDIEGNPIKLQIWDTSGEEKFKSIAKNFYRNANGVLLVYDICNRKSFDEVEEWISQIKDNADNDDIVLVLCGNKIDLENNRTVTKEEGQQLAKNNGISFFECSAKNGVNINEIFLEMSKIIYYKMKKRGNKNTNNKGMKLGKEDTKGGKKKGGCCGKK